MATVQSVTSDLLEELRLLEPRLTFDLIGFAKRVTRTFPDESAVCVSFTVEDYTSSKGEKTIKVVAQVPGGKTWYAVDYPFAKIRAMAKFFIEHLDKAEAAIVEERRTAALHAKQNARLNAIRAECTDGLDHVELQYDAVESERFQVIIDDLSEDDARKIIDHYNGLNVVHSCASEDPAAPFETAPAGKDESY